MWTYLNAHLLQMYKTGNLIPVCNNKADLTHLKLGTEIQGIHIPSLCLYTNSQYNPKYDLFLIKGPKSIPNIKNVKHLHDVLKPGYKWEDLYQYKGIIHIPYEISTMSIFEQYSANIPLFFPTKLLLLKMLIKNNLIPFNGPYIKSNFPQNVELALGNTWIDFWIDNADYYDEENMKYITYFDSFDDLQFKLETVDLKDISNKMKEWNKTRINKVYSQWEKIMAPLQNNKIITKMNDFLFNKSKVITTDKYLQLESKYKGVFQYIKSDVLIQGQQIQWRSSIHPETYPLIKTPIMITGHSDHSINDFIFNKFKQFSDYWCGINMNVVSNNTILKLPLGITNDSDESSIHKIYGNLDIMEIKDVEKSKCIYMNFNVNTCKPEREIVYDLFVNKPFVTLGKSEDTIEGRSKYLTEIKEHKFVLCPRGNGIDTHRLWETLYMKSIPIVKYENVYSDFRDLPILFINDWTELQDKNTRIILILYTKILCLKTGI